MSLNIKPSNSISSTPIQTNNSNGFSEEAKYYLSLSDTDRKWYIEFKRACQPTQVINYNYYAYPDIQWILPQTL